MAGARRHRRSAWAGLVALVITGTAAVAANGQAPDPGDPGDLPVNPEWLSNTLSRASTTTSVQNNLADGVVARRDAALAAYKRAKDPSPLARPEYLVVWSAKENGGGGYRKGGGGNLHKPTLKPPGPLRPLNPPILPRPPRLQVIHESKPNTRGTPHPD